MGDTTVGSGFVAIYKLFYTALALIPVLILALAGLGYVLERALQRHDRRPWVLIGATIGVGLFLLVDAAWVFSHWGR